MCVCVCGARGGEDGGERKAQAATCRVVSSRAMDAGLGGSATPRC